MEGDGKIYTNNNYISKVLYINFFIIQCNKCLNITILVQNIYEVVCFTFLVNCFPPFVNKTRI